MNATATTENQAPETAQENPTPGADAPDVPKKRGRGRPPREESAEPKKETASESSGTPRARKTAGKAKVDAGQMAKQIVGMHKIVFMMTGQQFPEIIISDDEGVAVATAVSAVCDQYDLRIDGKTGAFLQLFATAAMVYGPRALSIRSKLQQRQPVDVQSKVVEPGN